MALCGLLKVDEIYRVGGAQGVAALAFGTKTIPRVDKIVGPGNVYVSEAKRQVFGYVDIDMIDQIAHDYAGYMMMPLGLGLLWLESWLLTKLMVQPTAEAPIPVDGLAQMPGGLPPAIKNRKSEP